MLVLTRRVGEEVAIGDDIHVTVLATTGNKVRLGITAPRSVAVIRPESHGPTAEPTGRREPPQVGPAPPGRESLARATSRPSERRS